MATPSFSETVAALFLDKGGAVVNVKHPDFNPDATSATTRAATVQSAITYAAANNIERVFVPVDFQDYDTSAVTFDDSVFMHAEKAHPWYHDPRGYGGSDNLDTGAIDEAIAAAAANSRKYVWIPEALAGYDASAVTFNDNVWMLYEGGHRDFRDPRAYGADGTDLTGNDADAIQEAIDAATANSEEHVWIPKALQGYGGGNVTFDQDVHMLFEGSRYDWFDIRGYGAAVDGSTADDDAWDAAITGAENTIGTRIGGAVLAPKGESVVNSPIVLPHRVSLRGLGRGVSNIRAGSSFTFSGTDAVVVLGETGTLAFNTFVEDVTIDCDDVADSVGVYSECAQEQSGLSRVLVEDCKKYGVHMAQGATTSTQNYFLRDLELIIRNGSVGTTIGVKIEGGAAAPRGIDGLTVNANTGIDCGLEIDNVSAPAVFERMHFEDCDPCVRIGATTDCNAIVISGVDYTNDSSSISGTLIEIQGGSEITLTAIRKGDHNIAIDDQVNSHQVDLSYVGHYHLGRDIHPIATFTDGDTTPDVSSARLFETGNTSATTITNFDGGEPGQIITIKAGDNNTTIDDGPNIRLNGTADFAMGDQDTLTLVHYGSGIWREVSRMER